MCQTFCALIQMYTFLLFFLSIARSVNGFTCPHAAPPYLSCPNANTQIVFDTVNGNYGRVHAQFDLIINEVFPEFSWKAGETLIMTAAARSQNLDQIVDNTFSTELADSCDALNHLSQMSLNKAEDISFNETLADAAQYAKVKKGYDKANIVIFSSEQDPAKIDIAYRQFASYQNDGTYRHVCVIALNGAPFTKDNFDAVIMDVQVENIDDYPELAHCILKCLCGDTTKCFIDGKTPPPDPSPPSTTPESTDSTESPTLSPDLDDHACHCDVSTVWNDVMLVIDDSFHSTENGFESMLTVAISELGLLTIQKADAVTTDFHTRMGVVVYGDDASVVRGLGTLDNNGLDDLIDIKYTASPSSNLEKNLYFMGLEAAMTEISTSKNNRPNARNVIVVLTTTYSPPAGTDPIFVANKFKGETENKGIVAVYELTDSHTGTDAEDLKKVASEGFYYSSSDDMNDGKTLALQQAMCNANCFCPLGSIPFMSDPNSNLPEGGCYFTRNPEVASNQVLATKFCGRVEGGIIADDRSEQKSQFLQQVINEPSFWIGLTYDLPSKKYIWSDDKELSGSYRPFSADALPDSDHLCVSMNNGQWQPTNCRNSDHTICEINQCDSTFYCDVDRLIVLDQIAKGLIIY